MANFKKLYPLTYKVADKYGKIIVKDIKDILTREGKIASGTLIDSVQYRVVEDEDGLGLIVSWAEYGDYVDRGREPGSMPPVNKILDWVKLKGIQGRNKKGRFQKAEQTAFAIAKGIEKNGIEPTFFKTLAERNSLKGYEDAIALAMEQDIKNAIENYK